MLSNSFLLILTLLQFNIVVHNKQISKINYAVVDKDVETIVKIDSVIPFNFIENPELIEEIKIYNPLKRLKINSDYGYRLDPFTKEKRHHNGIDFYARNDTIFSSYKGTIKKAGNTPINGNYIIMSIGKSYEFIYLHLTKLLVQEDMFIDENVPIGITGNTGRSKGEHLHFSVKKNGQFINPRFLFNN